MKEKQQQCSSLTVTPSLTTTQPPRHHKRHSLSRLSPLRPLITIHSCHHHHRHVPFLSPPFSPSPPPQPAGRDKRKPGAQVTCRAQARSPEGPFRLP
ncbi:hypothetical protein E2C01_082074 [Portunus trituberculatus]|uniref:Uncharacterized protein n=1 Tax=Portunus trituberculatus TaxID=210409 RepID=A0A5B7IY37_PORTR|nr:hypothetical protein [Portunus trituberculatus]